MKLFRNFLSVLLLAVLVLLALNASALPVRPARLWVGGLEATGGGGLPTLAGSAEYDPETRTLTLRDAVLSGDFRGAGLYAEGDLVLRLSGENRITGGKSGLLAFGDLTVSGDGSLTLEGGRSGAALRGCLTVFDSVELALLGEEPLRWGKLHVSPMDVVRQEAGKLFVLAPYSVLLTDGAADAEGEPILGAPFYDSFPVRQGEPVPVPPEPDREGYLFGGWYADPELTEPFEFTRIHTEATVLYARWIRLVTLHYDCWGGSDVPASLWPRGDVPVPPPEPVREGWRFAGWYADEGLRTEYDWSLPLEADRWIYAKWEKLADYVCSGIDAAAYQGDVDWEALREGGYSFAFLRCGFRGYGSAGTMKTDDRFEEYYRLATAAGLDVGVYFFSQATSQAEALEEAGYVLGLLEGRELGLPVVMDFELVSDASGGLMGRLYDAHLSGEEYAEICLAFCREIEKNGYTAAVYAGNAMLRDCLGDALAAEGFGVWLAHWTVQTRYNGALDYWQYSGGGSAPGVSAAVDLDLRYVVTPPRVTGLTAIQGVEGLTLRWDRVPGAQGYLVYRAKGDGGFGELRRLSGAGSSLLTDPEGTEDCRYMVCAFRRMGGEDRRGELSEIVSPAPPS